MRQIAKLTLGEIKGDLTIYFNWSINALVPFNPGAADNYLQNNMTTIISVAQKLLHEMEYIPEKIYRGVLLKYPVTAVPPHEQLQFLSFTTDRAVAEHFARVDGFGHEIMDLPAQLGTYGYVIDYTPAITKILFHYHLLSVLPYAEALSLIGMDGQAELQGLMRQKEITILQPPQPFTTIRRLPAPPQ
ncbi:hypothetical protein [Chitinophaga cymbidii]|uniref:Uncharacterized protein n=1 Tax=Chitinophaga cymbidii TaxID=1096750 RepID=A0A512RFK3_9BACT|nr:hypothetical protein [Chitinophaga cymbidii]GEP94475.1 hypothetical protein CCY01nite_07350 [Chitinophaga cymbidii]